MDKRRILNPNECSVCHNKLTEENWYWIDKPRKTYHCRPCENKRQLEYYKTHPEQREAKRAHRRYQYKNDPELRLRIKAQGKQRKLKLKTEIMFHYGGKCSCCGETNVGFLTLDHVDGGGKKHLKNLGLAGGSQFYQWVKDNGFPNFLQCQCMNCNWGKSRNGGICPHKDPEVSGMSFKVKVLE